MKRKQQTDLDALAKIKIAEEILFRFSTTRLFDYQILFENEKQFALNLCKEAMEDVNISQDTRTDAKMIFALCQGDDSEYKSQLKNICIQTDLKVWTRLKVIRYLLNYKIVQNKFLREILNEILNENVSARDHYYAKLLFSETLAENNTKRKKILQELLQDSSTDINLWVDVVYRYHWSYDSSKIESIIIHTETSIEDKMWAKNTIANIFLSNPPETFTEEEAIHKARLLLEECLKENSISEKLKDCTQSELLGTYMNDDLNSCQKAYELSQRFIKENASNPRLLFATKIRFAFDCFYNRFKIPPIKAYSDSLATLKELLSDATLTLGEKISLRNEILDSHNNRTPTLCYTILADLTNEPDCEKAIAVLYAPIISEPIMSYKEIYDIKRNVIYFYEYCPLDILKMTKFERNEKMRLLISELLHAPQMTIKQKENLLGIIKHLEISIEGSSGALL